MRIAIASNDGTRIAAHTGRAKGFVIFEISEDGKAVHKEYRENAGSDAHAHQAGTPARDAGGENTGNEGRHRRRGTGHERHDDHEHVPGRGGGRGCGHGHGQGRGQGHSHRGLMETISDCAVLITRGLGPRLVADLELQGIDPYVCGEANVETAARLFTEGRLERASGIGTCRHPRHP